MSREQVVLFMERVADDPELQKKLEASIDSYRGDRKNSKVFVANNIMPKAKEMGFEFSLDEYLSVIKEASKEAVSNKLSDDDLEKAVGGSMIDYRADYAVLDDSVNDVASAAIYDGSAPLPSTLPVQMPSILVPPVFKSTAKTKTNSKTKKSNSNKKKFLNFGSSSEWL